MSILIIKLLPQSPDTQIPNHIKFHKALQLIQFVLQHAFEALELFYIKQALHEFDPHVGDTCCQIRAYQILTIHLKNFKENNNITEKLDELKALLNVIKQDLPNYYLLDTTKQKTKDHYTTLSQLFSTKYSFDITDEDHYLIQARILTRYKTNDNIGNPCIDYHALTAALGVSKNTARQLIHNYQISLSKISCNFIFELQKQLLFSPINTTLLKAMVKIDDDERSVLPCYWIMKVIYAHLMASKKIIIFNIKRIINDQFIDNIILPFIVTKDGLSMKFNVSKIHPTDNACFVILGFTKYNDYVNESPSEFIKRFMSTGVDNIIFSNMAIHPQYSGKRLQSFSHNPFLSESIQSLLVGSHHLEKDYLAMKHKANALGCCLANAFLFYIEHICCDKLQRQLDIFKKDTHKYLSEENKLLFDETL